MGRKHGAEVPKVCHHLAIGPSIMPDEVEIFGINLRAIRLRISAGAAAAKSPARIRDVARIGCEQAPVIKVDGREGT